MKYYVSSGSMKTVINADNEKEALVKAIQNSKVTSFGLIASVSERGFDGIYPEDIIYSMPHILNEMGLFSQEDLDNYNRIIDETIDGLDNFNENG